MAGRPSDFTQEIADIVCEQVATTSRSLRNICEDEGIPTVTTILNWLSKGTLDDAPEHLKLFVAQYARAREAKADFLAEEIFEIADDGSNDFMTITKGDMSYEVENKEWTSRSKLRVEARKWAASKFAPKKYGDKLDLTSAGDKLPSSTHTTIIEIVPPLDEDE